MTSEQWLRTNLKEVYDLPLPAVDWLLMIWQAIQLFDDVADSDKIDRNDLNEVIWNMLVGSHQNDFFKSHSSSLVPVLATMILKWQASDQAERQGCADARSFVWRAGYYDLILLAISLVHSPAVATMSAKMVMDLYGEKFEEYMMEFENA